VSEWQVANGVSYSLFAVCPYLPLRVQSRRDPADRRPPNQLADLVGRLNQLGHVDAGGDTHTFQHVDHVFGGNIAGGARRVRTAAKTAGRDRNTGEIKHFPLDAFNLIIQINLVGTFRCIAKSAAGMMSLEPLEDGDRGAIVNTASVAAQDGQIGQAAYTASKAGINGVTLVVARDLAQEGIRCNTIMPGLMDTPMAIEGQAAARNVSKAELRAARDKRVPLNGKMGTAWDVAHAALFLHSDEAAFITAVALAVDGGQSARSG